MSNVHPNVALWGGGIDGYAGPPHEEMIMRKFNLKLSRQIDALHDELNRLHTQPNTPIKVRKLLVLRKKLRRLEEKL